MPDGDKTLRETIDSVVQETQETSRQKSNETEEGISKGTSDETNTGETAEKEYVNGIDITDIPVEERPRIKELLSKKAKLL